ncbi:MAG TPA: hypothetical protein VK919_02745 [Solirubrobacterales bacterium]|nr:hypothetical protein [Solirubrobacterales bacterium]
MEGVNLGQASSEITIYAYCRKQGLKTRQVKKTLSASAPPTYTSQQVTARCPRGMTLVSGGVGQSQLDLIPPETFIGLVSRSKRVNRRTWSVKAFNSGDDSGDLIAQANCANGRALKQRQVSRSFGASPEQASLQARCRRSERVISGGFEWTGRPAGQLALITTFRKQGTRSWIAQAYGVDTTLTITAYCERK